MADRARTGNVLLDAWLDALTPLVEAVPFAAAGNGAASAANSPSAPFSWERIFLGQLASQQAEGSAIGPEAMARVTELWSDMAQRSFGVITALGGASNAGDPLGEALENSFGVMGDVGGAAAEGAALLAAAAKASSVLFVARETYRALMLATWQRAFEEITREAMRRAGEGKPVVTPAQWLSLSNSVADRVFVEAFNSSSYIDAQRRLSSALADQRRSEMQFVELLARFGHFPTRHALDAVSEEVSELRRRVRQLERASRGAAPGRRKTKAGDER